MPKTSPAKPGRYHPIVEEYLTGEKRLTGLSWDLLGPDNLVSRAVQESIKAYQQEASYDKAIALFQQANERPLGDSALTVVFLCLWAEFSKIAGRLEEMEAIIGRCHALLDKNGPPELRALVMLEEGLLAAARGNKARRLETFEEVATLLPQGSLYACSVLGIWGIFMAQLGRLAEFEHNVAIIAARKEERLRADAALMRFINAVEIVDLAEAARRLAEMDSLNLPSGLQVSHVSQRESYRQPFLLLSERWLVARRPPQAGGGPTLQQWAVVIDHLFARRPEEALESARKRAAEAPHLSTTGLGYDSFDLLRAELSNGNGEAARRILELRCRAGNVHYLEDFFQARAELAAGRREAAARHFAAAVAACDRYGARGRLDFELQLACELTPADLVWLGQASSGATAPPTPAPPGDGQPHPDDIAKARGVERLIGRSVALAAVREAVVRLAALDAPVLITGETGTGKELVARAIHESGHRSAKPFVAVNCGAISDSLLEAELFGHERGAFTGAERARLGIFEEAGEGTVFLDEIGDISPRLQVALLRVLETGEIRPVGSAVSRRISCRILAATNASLESLVGEKRFRQDLLYRLRRLEVHLSPLRQRKDDILPLADAFLCEGRGDGLRPVLSGELRERLLAGGWPGNVRELRNTIERMRLLNSERLHYGLVEFEATGPAAAPAAVNGSPDREARPARSPAGSEPADVGAYLQSGRTPLRRLERMRELFREHGRLTRGEMAAILGISPFTVTRDLKTLIREGLVVKRMPTPSPRTHYFELAAGSRSGEKEGRD